MPRRRLLFIKRAEYARFNLRIDELEVRLFQEEECLWAIRIKIVGREGEADLALAANLEIPRIGPICNGRQEVG